MDLNTYSVPVNEKKLIMGLSLIATFLLCAHGLLVCYNYLVEETPWYLLQMFDVNEEHNLPTWFSGFNLAIATTFLWIASREKRMANDSMSGRWTVLFAVFCFLSIDEIAGIHESINSVVEPTWAYGGAVIALVLGIYFIPFLKSLPRKTLIAFVISGAIFVGGAVGMEIVGEPMDSDSLIYNLTTMVEEGMEIFGIILFTKALIQYLSLGTINVGIKRT
ncbi:hypothetical protein HQ496_11390 [bacterium]|nr:hypothetical protein [bacterium]